MTCQWAHVDASYVLGALAPGERAAYEQHLGTCEECARSVQRLAGLPGLLARVPADVLAGPASAAPVPETLLPRLVRSARRAQRRRDLLIAGLAATTTATAVGGAVWLLGPDAGREPEATPGVDRSSSLGSPDVVGRPEAVEGASLVFQPVAWGTRLDLTCSYSERYDALEATTYTLVVRTHDGSLTQVGTWRALVGRTMTVTAAIAASADDIASVEVRTTSGSTVLRWTQ